MITDVGLILLIIFGAFVVFIIVQFVKAKHLNGKDRIICFSGEPGAGKTFNLVERATAIYRRQKLKYKLGLLKDDEPSIYSTFPMKIGKYKSCVLKREHLTFDELLPQNCIICISEFSEIACNLEWENPLVVLYLDMWIRMCRHFYNAYVLIDDQAFGQVLINIRRRTNTVYNLSRFRRFLGILPFYKVDVDELKCIEDTVNINNIDSDEQQYFFGFFPYKFMHKEKYNTRCYKDVIYTGFDFNAPEEWSDDLTTNYIIDLSVTKDEIKEYKAEGRKYALYRMFKSVEQGIKDCLSLAEKNGDIMKIEKYKNMLLKLSDSSVRADVTV